MPVVNWTTTKKNSVMFFFWCQSDGRGAALSIGIVGVHDLFCGRSYEEAKGRKFCRKREVAMRNVLAAPTDTQELQKI